MKVKRLVAGIAAASCLSGVFTVLPEVVERTYAAEIVSNDFERDYEGWHGSSDSVELIAQSASGYDMTCGMRVTGRTSPEDGAASTKGLNLFGSDKYTYSVKVFSKTAERFRLNLITKDGSTGEKNAVQLVSQYVPAGVWTELKASYAAPEDSYDFELKLTNDSTGDFFFDDVLITGDKAAYEAHAAISGSIPFNSGYAAADSEADSSSFLFHSTFEDGDDDWTGRGSASVATSSTAKYAGSKSLYVTDRADSWNGAAYSLSTSAFDTGTEYSFSVNACYLDGSAETQEFKFTLQYEDTDGTHYDQIALASAPKGEWVQLANTNYKLPSGASNMQIYVETTDSTNYGNFYIDEAIGAPAGTVIDGAGQPKVRHVTLGDLNFDECINSLDMISARKALLSGSFSDSMTQKAADVDQNRTYELADLVLLQEFILGKITEFPVNKPQVDLDALASKFGSVSLADSWKKDNENNPLTTQRFGADPGWMVYDGRLYIYTTNDAFEYVNGRIRDNEYEVRTINCVSTADMVNWTDHGAIPVAYDSGRLSNGAARWAARSWAPDAAWKMIDGKPKFFLYFANNGSGIGVLTADSPTGPWKDPIGHELISRNTPNCGNVAWLFDPGVYYDEATDEAYLFFGGGKNENDGTGYDNPKTGRCVKLGSDMISIEGTPQTMQTPYLFEDSSLIKIGNTWYYSYCANWNVPNGTNVNGVSFGNADILYMTNTNPLGPWTSSQLKGNVFKNTGTQGIDNGGNNHHSMIYFKGKYYVAYHSRQQEMRMNGGKDRNYRSTQINEASYNSSNGTITCRGDMTGVKQIENLDPTQVIRASTMANESKGISVSGVGDTTVEFKKGEWAKVSQVDFSKVQSGVLTAKASSKSGAIIKVVAGSRTGNAITYIEVPAGGSMETIETPLADIPNGATDIYFIANGDLSFDSWSIS